MNETTRARRLPLLDAARGFGLLLMIIYHAAWDLSWFGYLAADVGSDPGWKAFARVIATLFLMLVGVGLVLAMRAGFNPRRWLRRLATVGIAALAVSIATLWLFPESWIFFGILHHIALASVLALPFVRWPLRAAVVVTVVVIVAPKVVALPLMDAPLLQWIGLGTTVPNSNDFVPLLPWFAAVLAGTVVGRLLLSSPAALDVAARPCDSRIGRGLRLAGRHSLLVYLLHQPLLYGAVAGFAMISPAAPAPLPDEVLMDRCVLGCQQAGGSVAGCELRCACAETALQPLALWQPAMTGALAQGDDAIVSRLLRECPPA